MLRNVTFSDVDSTDEVAKEINKIIAEVNQLSERVEDNTGAIDALTPKKKVKKKKKKGSVLMRTLVSMVVFAVLLGSVCLSQEEWPITYDTCSTPNQLVQLLRNRFANITSNSYLFTPTDTAPPVAEGKVYYNESASTLYLYTGSAWEAIDVAGGLSLDGAYDVGITITVDAGAVALTATDAANNVVLALDQQDTAGTVAALTVGSAGDAAAIIIAQTGSGGDIEGTAGWSVTKAGVGTFVGLSVGSTDIVFTEPTTNDITIRADTDNEFEVAGTTEDVSFNLATSDTLTWTTDSSVATVDWGDLDAHTGLTDITGDATDFTISHTGSGAGADLLITQSGSGDNALTLTSGGTATDALGLVSSAGITMTSTVVASAWTQTATGTDDDLTISVAGAYDASLILSGAGTGLDAVSILTSHANGDIKINSGDMLDIDAADDITIDLAGASGEDIMVTNTGGSILLSATEDAADAIDIDATAGGIDIDAVGEAGQDIVITNTGGSISLVQTEAVDDGLNIDTTGGIDIDSALSIVITSAEDTADSITIDSATGGIDILANAGAAGDDIDIYNTGGSVNITSTEATDGAILLQTTNAAGQILLITADTTSDAIEIDNSGGFEMDCVDVIAIDNSGNTKDITITSALGRVVLTGTESADSAVEIVADGTAGGVTIDAKTSGITLTATGGDLTVTNTTAKDIIIDAQAGRVLITGTEDAADSIVLDADGAGGEITLKAKTGGIDMDATAGGITLDTSGASKDIRLDAGSGAVQLDGGETGATAVVIYASHAGGGIDMDYGTGGFSLVGASGAMVLTAAGAAGDVITITNTTGTGTSAIELTATAGSLDINAKEQIMIDLAAGTAGTSNIIITNTPGTDENAIELEATAGGVTLIGNAAKNIALNAGQILIESEQATAAAVQLLTNTGTAETILITNTLGDGAGAIALAAMAGGITATVEDGKDLKLGNEGGETYIVVATHGTAGSEDIRLVNGTGTDAAAIDFVATAGGIRGTVADGKDLLLRGADDGATIVIATSSTAGNEDIRLTNTNGTAEGAIEFTSTAGGIDLNANAAKDVHLSGGQIAAVAAHNVGDAILLHADVGNAQTIRLLNDESISVSEDGAAIQLTATAGGIQIQSDADLDDAIVLRVDGGTTSEMTIHNDTGDTATSIDVVSDMGGVTIAVAKLVTLGGGTVHSGIQDIAQGGTTTAVVLTNTVITVGADAGGDIVTIANGTAGQVLYLICEDATGTTTITPATFGGGTSITFNALGDAVTLVYTTDTGWNIVGGNSYAVI